MRKLLALLTLCASLLAVPQSHAQQPQEPDPGQDQSEIARELASLLAWRLGPEAVEQWCRDADPEGHAARSTAVKNWLARNADLIKQVDERVAEVVPLVYSPPPGVEATPAVRAQIKSILHEALVEGKTPEELKTNCQGEAKPENPRWANSGMRHVQQSLAVLYDWKIQLEKK
jgi:hypothetical protein